MFLFTAKRCYVDVGQNMIHITNLHYIQAKQHEGASRHQTLTVLNKLIDNYVLGVQYELTY